MTVELLLETVSEFRGRSYPDIPLPEGFDKSELPEDAFFATLPIGAVDARSGNNRVYTRSAIESIVQAVNESNRNGYWGHPSHVERTQRAPAIRWLGAVLDQDGTAWGKCYAITEEAARLLKVAKLTNSKIGTSISGVAELDDDRVTVRKVDLKFIDLIAEGAWVGVPQTSAVPVLTAETGPNADPASTTTDPTDTTLNTSNPNQENNVVPTQDLSAPTLEQVQELTAARDSALTQVTELQGQLTGLQAQIAELEQLRPDADQTRGIRQLINEEASLYTRLEINVSGYGNDLISVIKDTVGKLNSLMTDKLQAQMDAAVAEMVQLEDLRPLVTEMLQPSLAAGKLNSAAEIQTVIEEILAKPHLVALAEALVQAKSGPNAVTSAKANEPADVKLREQAVAGAKAIAERAGLVTH